MSSTDSANEGGTPGRILLTGGDPAGIGPDLILSAVQREFKAEILAVSSPDILLQRAKLLGLPLTLEPFFKDSQPQIHRPGTLRIISLQESAPAQPGLADAGNSAYVLECIRIATMLCLDGSCDAMVTTPVNKAVINAGGFTFSGHTEFIAHLCGDCFPVMMLQNSSLRVVLVTTHIPLSRVPSIITRELLRRVIEITRAELQLRMGIDDPRLLICGLNPHAGEGGYLGREEQDIIQPELDSLRQRGFKLRGPVPADTAFIRSSIAQVDAVVAMYHDQGLPVLKSLGFGESINITLGLPIIRTSVDHGTAYALAGTGKAHDTSLLAAIDCAIELAEYQRRNRV